MLLALWSIKLPVVRVVAKYQKKIWLDFWNGLPSAEPTLLCSLFNSNEHTKYCA